MSIVNKVLFIVFDGLGDRPINEYGYNFDNTHIDEEALELHAYRPKNIVNKDFFIIKR